MSARTFIRFVRLPSDVVLTPHIISGLVCKLNTANLRALLETAHNELDRRDGEPDEEREADYEPEPEINP
jgi:hypothetical protein